MDYRIGFLIQIILYALLWFISEYTAFLICIIMTGICGGVLLFASIAELIERSKVPKSYFKWMVTLFLAPLLVLITFTVIYGGNFDWLKE